MPWPDPDEIGVHFSPCYGSAVQSCLKPLAQSHRQYVREESWTTSRRHPRYETARAPRRRARTMRSSLIATKHFSPSHNVRYLLWMCSSSKKHSPNYSSIFSHEIVPDLSLILTSFTTAYSPAVAYPAHNVCSLESANDTFLDVSFLPLVFTIITFLPSQDHLILLSESLLHCTRLADFSHVEPK